MLKNLLRRTLYFILGVVVGYVLFSGESNAETKCREYDSQEKANLIEDPVIEKSVQDRVYEEIRKLSVHDMAVRVCAADPALCPYVMKVAALVEGHFHRSLIRIVIHESGNFKYTRGIHDKNDLCYFQVNKTYWFYDLPGSPEIWEKLERNSIPECVQSGAFVWLYNLSVFYRMYGRLPSTEEGREALYHHPLKVKRYYVRKLRRIKLGP